MIAYAYSRFLELLIDTIGRRLLLRQRRPAARRWGIANAISIAAFIRPHCVNNEQHQSERKGMASGFSTQ